MAVVNADVIVVGAGPAGATAARVLALGDVEVLLLDKAMFPRPKVCAGGLMQHVLARFPYTRDLVQNFNWRVRMHSPSLARTLTATSPARDRPLMAMTHGRARFDHALVQLAQAAGAELREAHEVTGVHESTAGVEVTLADDTTLRARALVAADSVSSRARAALGLPNTWGPGELGIAIEEHFALPPAVVEEHFSAQHDVHLFLYYGDAPGYGWLFPRTDSVNVGIGTDLYRGSQLKRLLHAFVTDCQRRGLLPGSVEVDAPRVALLPSRPPLARCHTKRCVLAGDAGAFCSPITGEGIYYAMSSGQLAAEAVLDAVRAPAFDSRALKGYARAWRKTLGRELRFQDMAKRKVLQSKRRCEKAIHWGIQDAKLGPLFTRFLMGDVPMKGLGRRMGYHYLRCKVKEKLGKL